MTHGREWDGSIVLVADPAPEVAHSGEYDRAIDRPAHSTVEELRSALGLTARRVSLVSDLQEFTDRAGRFSRSLVFPYWFGERSRSRHGLVPAVCEANGMMFVGADAFTKIVCNDKELSKRICLQAGLGTPAAEVVRDVSQLRFARHLRLPLMVKPNYEGTSLGITERNRCTSWQDAEEVAGSLLRELGQPVLIEEFVQGREFSACLMRTKDGLLLEAGSWVIDGRHDYLDDAVFSAELKTTTKASMSFERGGIRLAEEVTAAMKECFAILGKVDLLRIDGRLAQDGTCSIIELTPDIYMGADGEFATAFDRNGYRGFVSDVVRNCIEGYGAEFPM